ncbi:uncharacterized protein LOC129583769 isoform X2 [Paramacrobiotus metropolitanus]|uniref:uncharacterized protein LOC129583769 isoform X2 n=1 Tax=Paramacrobiotus metropolitanus TaxID=2943436 RepID=UPI002445FC24|nr:uncharacterized protein LOC129583769 isoform X2 [Paramacrobiotus metropolitanus]
MNIRWRSPLRRSRIIMIVTTLAIRANRQCHGCPSKKVFEARKRKILQQSSCMRHWYHRTTINQLAEKQTQTPPTQCSVDYTPKTRFSDSYVSEYSTGFVQHNSAAAQMLRGTTCRQRDQPLCSGPLHTVTTSQDSFRDLSPAYLHPDRTGSFQYQSSLRRSLGQPPHGDITPPTSLPITNTCDNAQSNRFTLRDCGFPDFAQPENVSMYSQSFVKSPENYKPPKSCKGSGALTSGGGHFFSRTESKEAFNGLGIDERHPLTFSIPSCHQYERAQANSESVMENINSVRKHLLRSAMPLLRSLPAGNPDFYTIKEKHTTDQECISSLHHEAKEASAARISRRVDCSLPSQCSSLTKFGDHTTYSVEYPWLTGRRPEPQLPLNHDMKSLITYDHNGPSTSTYKDAYLQRDYIRRNGMTENDYHLKKG